MSFGAVDCEYEQVKAYCEKEINSGLFHDPCCPGWVADDVEKTLLELKRLAAACKSSVAGGHCATGMSGWIRFGNPYDKCLLDPEELTVGGDCASYADRRRKEEDVAAVKDEQEKVNDLTTQEADEENKVREMEEQIVDGKKSLDTLKDEKEVEEGKLENKKKVVEEDSLGEISVATNSPPAYREHDIPLVRDKRRPHMGGSLKDRRQGALTQAKITPALNFTVVAPKWKAQASVDHIAQVVYARRQQSDTA